MDNLTFYPPEFMLKPTETFKKFQVFGKNCKSFKFLEKNAKTSSFWTKLQIYQGFGKFLLLLI